MPTTLSELWRLLCFQFWVPWSSLAYVVSLDMIQPVIPCDPKVDEEDFFKLLHLPQDPSFQFVDNLF